MTSHERRAVRAIAEVEDVYDALGEFRRMFEEACADGLISPSEVSRTRLLLARLARECAEALIAAQWTDAGERRAWGELAGGVTPRTLRYEREIARQAEEIGYDLGRLVPWTEAEALPQNAA